MLFSYLLVGSSYFIFLILLIAKDKESSLKESIHLKVAIIASIFWPLVMPLSILELKAKAKEQARVKAFAAIPRPVSMANGEIRYIRTVHPIEESTEDTSTPVYRAS